MQFLFNFHCFSLHPPFIGKKKDSSFSLSFHLSHSVSKDRSKEKNGQKERFGKRNTPFKEMYFLFPVHPFIHSLSLLPFSHKLTHFLFLFSFHSLSILSERKERESWELRSLAFPSLTLSLTHCFQSIKVQERGEKYFHLGFQFKVKLSHFQNLQTQINIIGKKGTIWREEE